MLDRFHVSGLGMRSRAWQRDLVGGHYGDWSNRRGTRGPIRAVGVVTLSGKHGDWVERGKIFQSPFSRNFRVGMRQSPPRRKRLIRNTSELVSIFWNFSFFLILTKIKQWFLIWTKILYIWAIFNWSMHFGKRIRARDLINFSFLFFFKTLLVKHKYQNVYVEFNVFKD